MGDRDSVVFVTEPMLTPEFVQFRVQAPLLQRLSSSFDVTIATPAVGPEVKDWLESHGVRVLTPGARFPPVRHPRDEIPSYVMAWGRDATLGLSRRQISNLIVSPPGLTVNLSMTTAIACDLWYLQGRPLGTTLPVIAPSLSPLLRLAATVLGPPLFLLDQHHFEIMQGLSRSIYTNSRFNALWYQERGTVVRGVLPQFYSSQAFSPSSSHPTRDYILVYLGKETDTNAVKLLMGLDFPIKMFGSKSAGWVEGALSRAPSSKIELLGRVSEEQLVQLYSNALFTAFPFTEEPFGLVPVESMACGTPVLTYRYQGPGETVLDGRTGWLTGSASQFIIRAHEICERGYPFGMVQWCQERAREFFVDSVAARWTKLLKSRLTGSEDPPDVRFSESETLPRMGPAGEGKGARSPSESLQGSG